VGTIDARGRHLSCRAFADCRGPRRCFPHTPLENTYDFLSHSEPGLKPSSRALLSAVEGFEKDAIRGSWPVVAFMDTHLKAADRWRPGVR